MVVSQKKLLRCGECDVFPCAAQDTFYHDGVPYHVLALENIKRIKADGLEKWLMEQEREHTCQCGKRRCGLPRNACIANSDRTSLATWDIQRP